jgi:glycosyltransferase involved in cell wall biosynthesis
VEHPKILHCIGSTEGGGAQTQLKLLLGEMSGDEFTNEVLCFENGKHTETNVEGLDAVHLAVGNNIAVQMYVVYRKVREIDPDILHLWLPEIMILPALLAGLICNTKVVSSCRRKPGFSVNIKQIIRDRLRYIAYIFSHCVICNFKPSISDSIIFRIICKSKETFVINNAVPNKYYYNSEKKTNKHNKREIFYVGRLVPHKNVGVLIRSFKILLNTGIKTNLHIFGEGPCRKRLLSTVKESDIREKVNFHGYVDTWTAKAEKGDIIALPSSNEGMPNVLMEAAASRLLIVASNIPEIRSLFEHGKNSLLSDINARDFANCLKCLFENNTLASKIEDNAHNYSKEFGVTRMKKRYVEVYTKIMD